MNLMKQKLLTWLAMGAVCLAVRSSAITVGSFGVHGEGGTKNGRSLLIGAGGSVFELDSFLGVGGQDLNGTQFGTVAQLSLDSIPAGVAYGFSWALSSDQADLVLTYSFSNTTSVTVVSNLSFFVFLDAEIDEAANTFFNENGTVSGGIGGEPWEAKQWQIDEPGFESGTLMRNLLLGGLSNSNAIPPGVTNDVAMALGFSRNLLWPGEAFEVRVMISEGGNSLGPLTLVQQDAMEEGAVIGLSGQGNRPGLSGVVFHDMNTNGVPDGGEGLSNVVVVLVGTNGTTLAQVTTDAGGSYSLGTPPGRGPYSVNVDAGTLPVGLTNNTAHPQPGSAYSATRELGETNFVLNWGYTAPKQQFVDATGALAMGFLKWELNRATGTILGTLSISNAVSSGASYGPPFQLGLRPAENFWWPPTVPKRTNDNGLYYVDLSDAARGQAAGGVIGPGQRLVLTNAVDIYSLTRTPPPISQFELWATRQ